METTWQTPTGWMIVQDLLVVDQLKHEGRRADYRRAPADFGATGVLLRIATCISGRVEVAVNCGLGVRLRGDRRQVELQGRRL